MRLSCIVLLMLPPPFAIRKNLLAMQILFSDVSSATSPLVFLWITGHLEILFLVVTYGTWGKKLHLLSRNT